jgi:hypothetical protein
LIFQLLNLPGQRRLGNVECDRRTANAEFLGDRYEISQVSQFERIFPKPRVPVDEWTRTDRWRTTSYLIGMKVVHKKHFWERRHLGSLALHRRGRFNRFADPFARIPSSKMPSSSSTMAALTDEVGDELHAALVERRPIQPLSTRGHDLTIDDAYRVQGRMLSHRIAQGERIVGKKVGATSKAVQSLLNDSPTSAYCCLA